MAVRREEAQSERSIVLRNALLLRLLQWQLLERDACEQRRVSIVRCVHVRVDGSANTNSRT